MSPTPARTGISTTETIRTQVELCLDKLRDGSLAAVDLQHALELIDHKNSHSKQSLLYIHARVNSVFSDPLSMYIVEDGQDEEAANDADKFLYSSVRQAMADGWRVIKFPEWAFALQDQETHGLGYEFILER